MTTLMTAKAEVMEVEMLSGHQSTLFSSTCWNAAGLTRNTTGGFLVGGLTLEKRPLSNLSNANAMHLRANEPMASGTSLTPTANLSCLMSMAIQQNRCCPSVN